jgi:hypothetical protein
MNKDRWLEKIIQEHLPAMLSGTETIDYVLASHPEEAHELRPKLATLAWLIDAGQALQPRPGFVASSRNYLEQRISSTPKQSTWQRLVIRYSPQRWFFNIAAVILLLVVLALAINNAVLYARLSLPGDPFYTVKLAIENVQLAFTFNIEEKSELYIRFSRERTTEFVELVLEGDYAQLPAAADRMETDIIAALHSLDNLSVHDPAGQRLAVSNLRESLSSEIIMLEVLRSTSPSSARPGIDLAIQVARAGVMALR